jgi:hypothetical protein
LRAPIFRNAADDHEARVFIGHDGAHGRGRTEPRQGRCETSLGAAGEVRDAAAGDVEAIPGAR